MEERIKSPLEVVRDLMGLKRIDGDCLMMTAELVQRFREARGLRKCDPTPVKAFEIWLKTRAA